MMEKTIQYTIILLMSIAKLSHSKFIDKDDNWIPRLKKNDLNGFTLVSRIPLTSLYKFNFYRDVSILYYPMPEDVEEALFTFKAHEDKISALGGNCEPQDIDVHLKPGGFPVVSPQNISFPEDFIDNNLRNEITSMEMESNESNNTLTIHNPVPGDWFALAFVSWTDPKSDKIEQEGIATVCDTVLYTDLRIKKASVTIKSCKENVQLILKDTKIVTVDFYKFYIFLENSSFTLNLSVISQCDSCKYATITIQARSLPSKTNNLMSCYVDVEKSKSESITVTFNSYPHEWHYLSLEYGYEDSTKPTVKRCSEIAGVKKQNLDHLHDLVRDTKSEYFTFEYNLPPYADNYVPSLLNVSSDRVSNLKFRVLPVQDIGGTLSIGISLKLNLKYYMGYKRDNSNSSSYFTKDDPFVKLVVCVSQYNAKAPLVNDVCEFNGKEYPATISVNSTDASSSSVMVHVPYPEVGSWYISMALFCDGHGFCPCSSVSEKNVTKYLIPVDSRINTTDVQWEGSTKCNASVIFSISSTPCIEGKCGRNGNCNYYMSGGFIYSTCRCRGGYAGWDCSDASNIASASEILTSVLLLTLSNLLFIPSIYFAIRRHYYTEATVYFFTMFFSTFYHACDVSDTNYSFCIVRLGVLQYCDFFCGLLSFWVTLVAMASLDNKKMSFLHMFGAIMIAFGTELNKQALLVFLVPVIIGVCIVAIAWGIRCKKTKKMFPARAYLILYLPLGLLLAAIGLICFAFFQTNANYHIIHSIWHMVIALSILCFLPNRAIFFPKS